MEWGRQIVHSYPTHRQQYHYPQHTSFHNGYQVLPLKMCRNHAVKFVPLTYLAWRSQRCCRTY